MKKKEEDEFFAVKMVHTNDHEIKITVTTKIFNELTLIIGLKRI